MVEQLKRSFLEPSHEYSPLPFWFWNDELKQEEILRQIDSFEQQEVMGFVIHPRMGVPRSMPYLSDEFMDLVEFAVEEAAKRGMQVILYDEGMYPSGAANGLVVKENPEFASRGLEMKEVVCDGPTTVSLQLNEGERLVSVQAVKRLDENSLDYEATQVLDHVGKEELTFVPPEEDGNWSVLVFVDTYSMGTIRGIHAGQDDGEPDAPRAADLLNIEATQSFIEKTHDRYYARLKAHFGKAIIAMFTDEPDMLGRRHRRGLKPWTNRFMEDFLAGGNQVEDLPVLWLQAGPETELIRRTYNDTVRKRLLENYYKPLSEWCEQHGIALTGHPAASDDIGLLEHFHIPGQDVVWRFIAPEEDKSLIGAHSTLGKCSSDAARHRNRPRNLNECFGVCAKDKGWDLPVDEMKWYLDWLLVRGVNMIVPHAFYYSIREERCHERPPDVGMNNIFWPEYYRFSRYIRRMSWLMTEGVNQTSIAVLTHEVGIPWRAVKPLFEQQLEFNYLEASLLPACEIKDGQVHIAKQQYKVIVVESAAGWDEQTVSFLQRFVAAGGKVVQLDTVESAAANEANTPKSAGANAWDAIGEIGQLRVQDPEQLPEVLRPIIGAVPTIAPADAALRISQLKLGGLDVIVLLNEGEEVSQGKLQLPISGKAELWRPWEGKMEPAAVSVSGEGMIVDYTVERRECIWIVVDRTVPVEEYHAPVYHAAETFAMTKDWTISGAAGDRQTAVLSSWTEWEGMEHVSGTVIYENEFVVADPVQFDRVELDLGEVHEMVHLEVNGKRHETTRFWAPYTFEIGSLLQPGKNQIRVEVTNSLANQYDKVSLKSGLIGPVKVQGYKRA